jgi:ribonuclease M5
VTLLPTKGKRKLKMESKPEIREVIVVEGRDDTAAIVRAVSAVTIETHGYGIKRETWESIKRAYMNPGIIVFTDPDYAGEMIRKRILEKFPGAKQAFISRDKALKNEDIGIENASPEDIKEALEKAQCSFSKRENEFSMTDLVRDGLAGSGFAAERRKKLADIIGIGYANAKTTLKRLNTFGVERDDYEEAIRRINKQESGKIHK